MKILIRSAIVLISLVGVSAAYAGFGAGDAADAVLQNPGIASNTLFQVSTFEALNAGDEKGDFSVRKLTDQGNFGFGTLNGFSGDFVVLDGKSYQFLPNTQSEPVTENAKTPFALITTFDPEKQFSLDKTPSLQKLGSILDSKIGNPNVPAAIRIEGTFSNVVINASGNQISRGAGALNAEQANSNHVLHNIKGTLVGFRIPRYLASVSASGYHFHFISEDRARGGHVVDVDLDKVQVATQSIHGFSMYIPNTVSFGRLSLIGRRQGLSGARFARKSNPNTTSHRASLRGRADRFSAAAKSHLRPSS